MKHDGDVDKLASNRQLDGDSSHATKGWRPRCLNDVWNQETQDVGHILPVDLCDILVLAGVNVQL